ncbi:unnamed protein product [Protopolystoma xenopodis]|uniref:Uncharacterized protein n=1 Tax=Protopolystoma xenopodis TaxID=117903 RepID=A0A448XR04_9PLAT|nr:unnamed protein product [Protopolystoma xenopodis]
MSLSVDASPAVCDSEESGGEHVLNDSQLQWVDCVELIGGFNTVEHFWNVLMTNPKMSDLPNGTDALTFKSHIAPKWEDPRNENGGRWLISNLNKEDADSFMKVFRPSASSKSTLDMIRYQFSTTIGGSGHMLFKPSLTIKTTMRVWIELVTACLVASSILMTLGFDCLESHIFSDPATLVVEVGLLVNSIDFIKNPDVR